jgi:hypothetical protein
VGTIPHVAPPPPPPPPYVVPGSVFIADYNGLSGTVPVGVFALASLGYVLSVSVFACGMAVQLSCSCVFWVPVCAGSHMSTYAEVCPFCGELKNICFLLTVLTVSRAHELTFLSASRAHTPLLQHHRSTRSFLSPLRCCHGAALFPWATIA